MTIDNIIIIIQIIEPPAIYRVTAWVLFMQSPFASSSNGWSSPSAGATLTSRCDVSTHDPRRWRTVILFSIFFYFVFV